MANKDLVSEEVLQELINKLEEIVNNYCYNLEYFTPTDIEGFFDGTQQEIDYYSSLIKDDVVSKNFLHSSKQIADDIAQSILEANEYTDSLLKNISSIQLEWCATNLPTTGENNKIYILPVTSGSGSTKVNTLNIWNNTSNDWVSIGNLEIDITQFYNKTEIDTKMDLKANKTEVVANDKIVQTLDSATNSSDTVLSTSGLQTEMDKKANNDEVIKKTDITTTIDSSSTDSQVPSAKSVYEKTKNMCTTSIADKSFVSLTSLSSNYTLITVRGTVKNGFCTCTLGIRVVNPVTAFDEVAGDAPKPQVDYYVPPVLNWGDVSELDTTSPLHVSFFTDGVLRCEGGVAGKEYYTTAIYPVAES